MDELSRIERRLAFAERMENPLSFTVGGALAALYFGWMFFTMNYLATYTWIIPCFIGIAIVKFWFSVWVVRLERARDAIVDPAKHSEPVPSARVVSDRTPRDRPRAPAVKPEASPAPPIIVVQADSKVAPVPRAEVPSADGDGPKFLA